MPSSRSTKRSPSKWRSALSILGARAICAMKHVGMNVASDAFMTFTLTGVESAAWSSSVADDVGLSSSQNEQDSRYWAASAICRSWSRRIQEAYKMTREAFELSERFATPVILRTTTRVCHVKAMVTIGSRTERPAAGFKPEPQRWVMVPSYAQKRLPVVQARDRALAAYTETSPLNVVDEGTDRRIGFVTSGPTYLHLKECFPAAPILKLGFSHPVPVELVRRFAAGVDGLVVAEKTEPLIEIELKAAGITVRGKDVLPRSGELLPGVLTRAVKALLGEPQSEVRPDARPAPAVFPRPPTLCAACPHLAVYFALAHLRSRVLIAGDIGCYTLGAGHPWNALDTCISMGASMGVALGLDKARGEADKAKSVIAVIGNSTFLHMGMQGLLNITYSRGNVTVLLLDNRTTGMTGGQNNPASGRDVYGEPAPEVDFAKLVEALGVKKDRIRVVDAYELPTLYKAIRQEIAMPEPSVIITQRPCTLIDLFERRQPYRVLDDRCTGCGSCTDVGCPAITVTRRAKETKAERQRGGTSPSLLSIARSAPAAPCAKDAAPKPSSASARSRPRCRDERADYQHPGGRHRRPGGDDGDRNPRPGGHRQRLRRQEDGSGRHGQRGGVVNSHLRFGRKVLSPVIPAGCADILVAFELAEGLRWSGELRQGGVALMNTLRLPPPGDHMGGLFAYPDDPVGMLRAAGVRSTCLRRQRDRPGARRNEVDQHGDARAPVSPSIAIPRRGSERTGSLPLSRPQAGGRGTERASLRGGAFGSPGGCLTSLAHRRQSPPLLDETADRAERAGDFLFGANGDRNESGNRQPQSF